MSIKIIGFLNGRKIIFNKLWLNKTLKLLQLSFYVEIIIW